MRPLAANVCVVTMAGFLMLASRSALAAWPHDSAVSLPVCTAPGPQFQPRIVSDGSGGAIVTWADRRGGTFDDIFAQHILASGSVDPAWPLNGRALCTNASEQFFPVLVGDGQGGAIVAWQDSRSGADDIYAQHVLASGVVDALWPVDGRAVCAATSGQQLPCAVSDGAGGVIVAWADLRNAGQYDIYAQRVLASGAVDPAWPLNGRALCNAVGNQQNQTIASDGVGGAIVAWQDLRSGNLDIYAQHVQQNGVVDPNWPVDGRALCSAINDQQLPVTVTDMVGGAIVVWQDSRAGATSDIYAQHVTASGVIASNWPADGRAICTAVNNQINPTLISDGSGGAFITWKDDRAIRDVYVQHLLNSGLVDAAWPTDGRALGVSANNSSSPGIVTDGANGLLLSWEDYRNGVNYDIYAQHVLVTGAVDPVWPASGLALCTAGNPQAFAVLAPDGDGGAIAAWYDERAGGYPYVDIYAQRFARFGFLGTPEAEITGAEDVPNDQGGRVKLSWNASWLDTEFNPNLDFYEIYRSVPTAVAEEAIRGGAHRLLSPGQPTSPGERAFLVPFDGTESYAWEYLARQDVKHYLPAYSYVAQTTGDSTGANNPTTVFMIVARNNAGDRYWLSRPDSGYSVDNLAPPAPTALAAAYYSGATHLSWNVSPAPDFSTFRLYRGTRGDFVPSAADLIASTPETSLADVGPAGRYYKVSALDRNGNEGAYTSVGPDQTVDVPAPDGNYAFALEHSRPNPTVHGRLVAEITLPSSDPATIAVIDVMGRVVLERSVGGLGPGHHVIDFGSARRLVGGIYFVKLTQGERRQVERVAVLD